MNPNPFKGLGTALVTPFLPDGGVDFGALKVLVDRQLQGGVDMIIPCGTTGEAVTLTDEEYSAVVGAVVDQVARRIKVVAGAGSNSTAKTIHNARIAQDCGVDAVLVVGPYYNKPTQEGYYQHFATVAKAVRLPMIIYNVPGRTGGNIAAETQIRLSKLDNIVATKEASANFSQIMHILAKCADDFHVLSGDDNLALPQMSIGVKGVISVISNEIPREFAEMVHAAMDGNLARAREIHYRYLELMETNFVESSPIPVKAALGMMGLIGEYYRLPLVPISDAGREKLRAALQRVELVD